MRRLAVITKPFLDMLKRLRHKEVWRSPPYKNGRKYLRVLDVSTGEKGKGFYYVERLGVDSVAFILRDDAKPETPYIALNCFHSPLGVFQTGAFSGSLDKPNLSKAEIVCEEVLEEAGYTVGLDRVRYLGSRTLGASTNELVHLYVVDVTGVTRSEKEPENEWEANTNLVRVSVKDALSSKDWKLGLISVLEGGGI